MLSLQRLVSVAMLAVVFTLAGCSTSQKVQTVTAQVPQTISAAVLVPSDGNSPEMDAYFVDAFKANSSVMQKVADANAAVPSGTDLVVRYTDVWRWDLVMYLFSLDVTVHDARSGNMLLMGQWKNSALHGFPDAKQTVRGLVDEMFVRLKTAKSQ